MRKKTLSILGYIMEQLNIKTVAMARSLHVDASLISKWKTGDRKLSTNSVYFDDIINYLLEQDRLNDLDQLKTALTYLYPHENLDDYVLTEKLLRQSLLNTTIDTPSLENKVLSNDTNVVQTLVFEENQGRREAMSRLLDFAESMTTPGEFVFIDSEEYNWLIEDSQFAQQFTTRIANLLKAGFHAKFVIHYSSYRARFIHLFDACSQLIFHRNVNWYYSKYYDENIFQFSFFVLNRSVSLLGISAGNADSSTMIFADSASVTRHESLAKNVLNHPDCECLFTDFKLSEFPNVIDNIYQYRKESTFYSFLPAPAFFAADSHLLKDILISNHLEKDRMQHCLALNERMREITSSYFSKQFNFPQPFIYIFQLEEMIRRAKSNPFISRSLTILADKTIKISPEQYAKELRMLANGLTKHSNLHIILVSTRDNISLPSINCWCKQNECMMQMDKIGFRMCDEINFVNATSTALEYCMKKVPPERKEKKYVRQFLLELADEIC